MDDDLIPPIEYEPPYSLEFVSHLHGSCYGDDVTPSLLAAVRADEVGARMLDSLTVVQLEMRLHGS